MTRHLLSAIAAMAASGALQAAPLQVATFENLPLEGTESYWWGDPEEMMSDFTDGSFTFPNYCMEAYQTWAFFGYSNRTATNFETLFPDQFNSAVGSGADKSKVYAVVYAADFMGHCDVIVGDGETPAKVDGTWVTNAAYTFSSITQGDAFAGSAFAKDDWYKVTFIGLDEDGETTGSVDFYLADYRSENSASWYVLDSWQWCDLTPLGEVCSIRVTVDGTRKGSFGLNTPAYLCIDNFGDACPVTTAETLAVNPADPTFDIKQYFTFNADAAPVEYSIISSTTDATIEGSTVTLTGADFANKTVTVRALQKGCAEYVAIPLATTTGINTIDATGMPEVKIAGRIISASDNVTAIDVFTTAGTIAAHTQGNELDASMLPAGVYIVRATSANGTSAIRVALR